MKISKKCDFHVQGCLQLDDGRLKLSSEMINLWARSSRSMVNIF
jgi:hypothetical protein